MARRVVEEEQLANAGIVNQPMGCARSIEVLKEARLHKTYNGVFSLQFNYTGEILAVGFGTGGIQIFNTETGNMVQELRACRQGGFAVMVLRYHPKNADLLYAGTAEGVVYVYNIKTGSEVDKIPEPENEINALDFCVDGFEFVTGGRDLGVRVYDSRKNQLIREWAGSSTLTPAADQSTIANTMRIFCIKFHPNNQYIFVSGGWDNHLKIWDVRDNTGVKRNIRGPHICGDSIDMWTSGNEILSGQWTALHSLQEYNYSNGAIKREINFPHKEGAFLYAAQYLNENTVIAGGSGTNRAEIIDISSDRTVGGYSLEGPVQAVDSALLGRKIAVGGKASVFTILQMKD